MVRINKVYTKTGDDGTTMLIGGNRVPKHNLHIQCAGEIDLLNSHIGKAVAYARNDQQSIIELLTRIQQELFDIGANISCSSDYSGKGIPKITENHVTTLESDIDHYNEDLEPLKSFRLPGGTLLGSELDISRAICRTAERSISELKEEESVPEEIVKYINRLSDLLFVLARYVVVKSGAEEVLWDPGSTQG